VEDRRITGGRHEERVSAPHLPEVAVLYERGRRVRDGLLILIVSHGFRKVMP
jgi:hypothetical protein